MEDFKDVDVFTSLEGTLIMVCGLCVHEIFNEYGVQDLAVLLDKVYNHKVDKHS